jgi:hypothetical protein
MNHRHGPLVESVCTRLHRISNNADCRNRGHTAPKRTLPHPPAPFNRQPRHAQKIGMEAGKVTTAGCWAASKAR